jgi:hypothetical protein
VQLRVLGDKPVIQAMLASSLYSARALSSHVSIFFGVPLPSSVSMTRLLAPPCSEPATAPIASEMLH